MAQVKIAVIGGTGLQDIEEIRGVKEVEVETPFGKPSGAIAIGKLEGVVVAFLPRHGKGHTISPTELPSRANIYALKSLGVEWVIAVNAVGSFKEEIKPADLLVPDQLIDRTRSRANSFFGEGIVAHVAFADPFCPILSALLSRAAQEADIPVHTEGTYVCMEGFAFSTRAESRLYRSWGADIVGMTALPEAKLAREAEMCYAVIAGITDYDSWLEDREPVTVAEILENLRQYTESVKEVIRRAVKHLPEDRGCECVSALKGAIVTDPKMIPAAQKKKLRLLIEKYIKD